MTTSLRMQIWNSIKAAEPVVLVLSILFLGYQSIIQTGALTAQERALNAQMDQSLTAQNNDINKIFIEHPELRPFFYDKVPPPAEPATLKSQVDAVAEMYLDFIEQFETDYIKSLPKMNTGEAHREQWNQYFLRLFERAPVLCIKYEDTKKYYTQELFEPLVKAKCGKKN